MSLFRAAARMERRTATLAATLEALGVPLRSDRGSPAAVTNERAMRQSAVWSCVNLIADLVSSLPIDAYKKLGTVPVPVAPRPSLLISPSQTVDSVGWARQVLVSWLQRGTAYGDIQTIGRDGWPTQVEILHPDLVKVRRDGLTGPLRFEVNGREVKRWPQGNLWVAPGLVVPGNPLGLSVLEYARRSIGLGVAASEFGEQWFDDGAHPSSILKNDRPVDEPQAKAVKQRFIEAVRGKREPAVLGGGWTYEAIQVSPNESQFLDTIKANVEDIARFFFPSFVLNVGAGSVTYQNVEQRSLNLLTYDLESWITRYEKAVSQLLPGGAAGQYVKCTREALLRTDAATRYRLHDSAIRAGWKSRNEIREKEELPPIDDGSGDEYLWPPYRAFPLESDQEK